MLSDKYIAGLIDSDGYIGLHVSKQRVDGLFLIRPRVSIKQLEYRASPLYELANTFDVKVSIEKSKNNDRMRYDSASFIVVGDKALRLLERVKGHLVLKCDLAEYLIHIDKQYVNQETLNFVRKAYKNIRNSSTELVRNFPSRKWLAGYFDGDGCIRASCDSRGKFVVTAMINSFVHDTASLKLIEKVFGGHIYTKSKNGISWKLNITKNNVDKFISYFHKHSIIKKGQLDYVLGYLRSGKQYQRYNPNATRDNRIFCNNLSAMKSPATTE